MEIVVIVAVSKAGVIGNCGTIPWRVPEDLARFKRLTLGHTLVMGRRTFESLPRRPLPGRRTLVVSGDPLLASASSLEQAISIAKLSGESELFLCGGKRIYEEGLDLANRIEMTVVDFYDGPGDTFLNLDLSNWSVIEESRHPGFRFLTYIREAIKGPL